MSTTNPKISAYIPQHLYDAFVSFCTRKEVSMSKGVALLFSEYFGIDYSANSLGEFQSVAKRLQDLEERLCVLPSSLESELLGRIDDLSSQVFALNKRLEAVEHSSSVSELLVSQQTSDIDDLVGSEQLTALDGFVDNEVYKDNCDRSNNQTLEQPDEVQSKSLDNVTYNQISLALTIQESDESLNKIDGDLLARRIGVTVGTLKNKKSKLTNQEFTKWTAAKDTDQIPWVAVKSGSRVHYEPAIDLEGELLSRLQKWITKNRR